MDYEKLYFAFSEKFKNQEFKEGEYTEVHHIIPRYAGGEDSDENLVRVTYRQHVFLHKLLAKYTQDPRAICAYNLMSGKTSEERLELARAAGRMNVLSGQLDRIRHLANTPERQLKLKELNRHKVESGEIFEMAKKGNAAWRGQSHTEEWKKQRSALIRSKMAADPEHYSRLARERGQAAGRIKTQQASQRSKEVIENAERNEEYLHKSSYRSKNLFVSPEGLEFDGPYNAAMYYGNVPTYTIDNWCKREQFGWYRKPKPKTV